MDERRRSQAQARIGGGLRFPHALSALRVAALIMPPRIVPTEHFGQRTTQVLGLETPGTTGADLVLAIDEQSKGEPSVDGEQGTVPERPQQPPPIN
mmetsp:Transcript_9160/g.27502  ORF Transcript_9160/g.27502 Transcript_9160/m.27502 type:complete len:96 (-) Transcript_9160:927-1214(-)